MPAVAAVGAVIAALMALLIVYGVARIADLIARFFPQNIPGLGVPIHPREWVTSAARAIIGAVDAIFGVFVAPMIGFIGRPVVAVLGWVASVERFVVTAALELQWLGTNAIPDAISAAKRYAHDLVAGVGAYALSLYRKAISYTAARIAAVGAYAHDLYAAARAYTKAEATAVGNYAHDLYIDARKAVIAGDQAVGDYASGLVRAARADLGNAIKAVDAKITAAGIVTTAYVSTAVAAGVGVAEDFTTAAIKDAITAVDVDSIRGLVAEFPGILDDVTALEGVIASDLPDIGAAVRAIPRDVPADLADALTITGALSIPMLRYMRDCGVPNCRNLGKIGRDLQHLFGALEGAGFLALIGYMVADPDGAAHEAADVLGSITTPLVGAARDLIGV